MTKGESQGLQIPGKEATKPGETSESVEDGAWKKAGPQRLWGQKTFHLTQGQNASVIPQLDIEYFSGW